MTHISAEFTEEKVGMLYVWDGFKEQRFEQGLETQWIWGWEEGGKDIL